MHRNIKPNVLVYTINMMAIIKIVVIMILSVLINVTGGFLLLSIGNNENIICMAFSTNNNNRQHRFMSTSYYMNRKKSNTQLNINFSWFGSSSKKDNDIDENSNNKSSIDTTKASSSSIDGSNKGNSNIGGVAGIVESMESFRKSQRIGKLTSTLVQELTTQTVEGIAENGKVKIIYDSLQRPISTYIDETYCTETDVADISNAITIAMKDAHTKSIEKMDEKMKNLINDLGLPS